MKKLLKIALVALLAFGMFACGDTGPTEKQTVVWWHTFTDDQKDTLEAIIAEFNAANEGKIEVIAEAQEYSGFTQKVMNAVAEGVGPDIIFNYASEAANYVEDGKVVDFGKYMKGDYSKLVSAGIYAESTGFSDGKLHVIPGATTGPIFFYNKTIYDKYNLTAPKTWAELASNSKIVYEGEGIVGFTADSFPDMFQAIMMQNGIPYIDVANKKVGFNTPEMKEWLEWFAAGVKEGYFQLAPQTGNYNSEDISALRLVSYIGSSAGLPYLNLPEGYEIATAPLPQSGTETNWAPAWNRGAILFTSNPNREKAAVKFIEFFINETNNTKWAISMSAFSPYYATQENEDYKAYVAGNIALIALGEQINYSGVLPTPAGSGPIRDILDALVKKVATGTDTTEALNAAEKEANDSLQNPQ